MTKWRVVLTKTDHKKIKKVLRSKKVPMEVKKRAQVLLDVDEGCGRRPDTVNVIEKRRGMSRSAIVETRRKFAQGGIDTALFRKKRQTPPTPAKVTGEVEANIIACACSSTPSGYSRWSAKMIADKIVLDGIIDSISDETVRLVLKKHDLNRT